MQSGEVALRIHTLLQAPKENLHDARRCHNVSCAITCVVAVSASPLMFASLARSPSRAVESQAEFKQFV